VATTYGVLGTMSRKYAHRIPFIVKMNHNELLTLPNKFDQIMFGSGEQAYDPSVLQGWAQRSTSDPTSRPARSKKLPPRSRKRTAVIKKRAGGTGLISGRKAFQRPMAEGIELLNAIQDVYLDSSITVA
jgi:DhnA family fructose-bisphosphate aldolase class Ia